MLVVSCVRFRGEPSVRDEICVEPDGTPDGCSPNPGSDPQRRHRLSLFTRRAELSRSTVMHTFVKATQGSTS
jgi:hypothetical protein